MAVLDSEETISRGRNPPLLVRLREFTPMVLFMTFYLAVTAWNFGYDVSVFNGVQAMNPFLKRFGTCSEKTGKCVIAPEIISIMNSFPYLGKLLGCWIAQPVAERLGRKKSVITIAITAIVGVILQITATTTAQFTVGRCLCYAMTGISVIVMPAFMAECAPAVLRGLISTQLQLQINASQVVASGVNYATSTNNTDAGWRTSIGIQFIMPGLLLVFWPLIVESPRWLIAKGRLEEAEQALRRLRKKNLPEAAIAQELKNLSRSDGNEGKGTWKEVFTGTNRRRTMIACVAMVGQQLTGQAFVSQYSITFYKQQGLTNSFQLGIVQQCGGLLACIGTAFIVDNFGRRPILIFGGTMCTVFLVIMGSMGTIPHPNSAETNMMAASVIIWFFFYILAWAPLPYVVIGETSTRRVIEKANNLAVSLSVVSAFLVSFTVPYLIGPTYANLGGKVGYIYAALSLLFVVLAWLYIPEMKGRTLEEIDRLFEERTPTRKFKNAPVKVEGVGVAAVKTDEDSQQEDAEDARQEERVTATKAT